jgi:hypothetical protein
MLRVPVSATIRPHDPGLMPRLHDLNGTVPLKSKQDSEGKSAMSKEEDIDRLADEAWEQLNANPDWAKWRAIGDAMMYARNACMRDTQSNRPAGRGYNAAFSAWLAKRKFGDMDGSDRARLFKCMDNLREIEAWRATLTETERLRLNHPSTVLRKWQAATKLPDSTKGKKLSPMSQLKVAHVALMEVNAKLKKQIEQGDGNLFTRGTSAREAARLFVDTLGEDEWERVVAEAKKLIAARKSMDSKRHEFVRRHLDGAAGDAAGERTA